MSEVGDIEEGKRAAVLGEFQVALAAAKKNRAAVRQGAWLLDVALTAGRREFGKFSPLAVTAGRQVELRHRVAVAPGNGRCAVASALAARSDSPLEKMKRSDSVAPALERSSRFASDVPFHKQEELGTSFDVPSYKETMSQARQEAMVTRARRQVERQTEYLPARGPVIEGMPFAPRAVRDAAAYGELQPIKAPHAQVPGLRRQHAIRGAMAKAEEARHDLEPGPVSQHFTAQPVPEHEAVPSFDIKRALDEYFFRQSRLPPNGGAGFNPQLSPIWAGLKLLG